MTHKQPTNYNHIDVIKYFCSVHWKHFKAKYHVNWGKDGAAVKRILKTHDLETIELMIDEFFTSKDDWIKGASKTISVFSTQINKLIQDIKKPDKRKRHDSSRTNPSKFSGTPEIPDLD